MITPSHPYEVQVGIGGPGSHIRDANPVRKGGNSKFAHFLFATGGEGPNGGSGGGGHSGIHDIIGGSGGTNGGSGGNQDPASDWGQGQGDLMWIFTPFKFVQFSAGLGGEGGFGGPQGVGVGGGGGGVLLNGTGPSAEDGAVTGGGKGGQGYGAGGGAGRGRGGYGADGLVYIEW